MTDTQPTTVDDDLVPVELRVKPIADELEEVRARIKDLQTREKELTLEARAETGETAGRYGPIEITVPRNLDPAAVAEAYPVTTHPYLYKLAIDPAKAKAHLGEATLDRFKVDGTPRVSVKR